MTEGKPEEGAARKLPIAIDAMGGDHAPEVIVAGVVAASQQGLGPALLYGKKKLLEPVIRSLGGLPPTVELRDAPAVIEMGDPAAWAARTKKDSSIHLGLRAVRDGEARAFFSAGNSGAVIAVSTLQLKRLENCARPAIVGFMPSAQEPVVLVDMGANTKVKAHHLVQFGLLGECFARVALERPSPRVGLLSNGTEESKGTELLRQSNDLLRSLDINYLGYIEAGSLPLGQCDVVICDGFVGNVVLKLSEGIVDALTSLFRRATRESFTGRLAKRLLSGPLQRQSARLDWRRIGGAPLLGLEGLCVISHGAANAEAICAGLLNCDRWERAGLVDALRERFSTLDLTDLASTGGSAAFTALSRERGSSTPLVASTPTSPLTPLSPPTAEASSERDS